MVREIKAYQTPDGRTFSDEREAYEHELRVIIEKDRNLTWPTAVAIVQNLVSRDEDVIRILNNLSKIPPMPPQKVTNAS